MKKKKTVKVSQERLKELYGLMLDAQETANGFDLSFDEIVEAWGYKSKSAATVYLPILVDAGLVISRTRNRKTSYRAIRQRKGVLVWK